MKYFAASTAMATLAFLMANAAPARADLQCGSLMMPAGPLKEVSRGISSYHAGLDLVAPHGSPLRAAAGGTIVTAGPYFAYGKIVDIAHGNGVVTRYAHMAGFAAGIRPGVEVAAGQVIGQVGRTGRATTAHVHFEVRINGRAVDPKPYLSLAACNPRTPSVRFDEAKAPSTTATPQVAEAQTVRPAPPSPRQRIDARPGGLLE